MKNKLLQISVLLFALASFNQVHAVYISDNYIGSDDHGYGDVIGSSHYEVYGMDVTVSGGMLTVRIDTNFSEANDRYGIEFGDLFISSNGWNPYGAAPYTSDNSVTGEQWEYVFDTSAGALFGGDFSIYNSEDRLDRYTFRNGQEVQRNSGGDLLTGSNLDLSHAGNGGYISYNIMLSSLGISGDVDLGLKWGMMCANDTIEGMVTVNNVPEPYTALLMLSSLILLPIFKNKSV